MCGCGPKMPHTKGLHFYYFITLNFFVFFLFAVYSIMQAIIEKYLIKLQLRICSRKYTITKNTHFLDIATLQIGKEKTHYLHTFGPYEDDYLATYR